METQLRKTAAGSDEKISTISRSCNLILRLLAIAVTLAAAVVMGLGKETKTVSITVAPSLPPLPLTVTAKTSYSSAFVYFIVANAIACFYSVISLVLSIANKRRKTGLVLMISVADIVMLALLFSGNGAAAAIGMVGEKGIPKVGWNKVCNVYIKFCSMVIASLLLSLVACLAYVAIVLLALVGLHKKSA